MAATVQPTAAVQVNGGQRAAGVRKALPGPAGRFQNDLRAAGQRQPPAPEVQQRPGSRGDEKKSPAKPTPQAAEARTETQPPAAELEPGLGDVVELGEPAQATEPGDAPQTAGDEVEDRVRKVDAAPLTVVATVGDSPAARADAAEGAEVAPAAVIVAETVAVDDRPATPAVEPLPAGATKQEADAAAQQQAVEAAVVRVQRQVDVEDGQEASIPHTAEEQALGPLRPDAGPRQKAKPGPALGEPGQPAGEEQRAGENRSTGAGAKAVMQPPVATDAATDTPAPSSDGLGRLPSTPARESAEPSIVAGAPRDGASGRVATPPASQAPPAAEARFVQESHPSIVTAVRTRLLPDGGTMQIRLDPPELGALQLSVSVRGGAITALFQTSSDEATRLLSHTLSQLKAALEGQGVTVEKLQVQQARRDEPAHHGGGDDGRPGDGEHPGHRDQQRRQALNRMWRRRSGGGDPLDVVA